MTWVVESREFLTVFGLSLRILLGMIDRLLVYTRISNNFVVLGFRRTRREGGGGGERVWMQWMEVHQTDRGKRPSGVKVLRQRHTSYYAEQTRGPCSGTDSAPTESPRTCSPQERPSQFRLTITRLQVYLRSEDALSKVIRMVPITIIPTILVHIFNDRFGTKIYTIHFLSIIFHMHWIFHILFVKTSIVIMLFYCLHH